MMISKAFMDVRIYLIIPLFWYSKLTLQNFEIAIMLTDYWNTLVNTLSLSVLVTVLETISCLIVAYGLARFEFKLRVYS